MTKTFIDFESKATLNIKTCGAWKYAMHRLTGILCLAHATRSRAVEVLSTAALRIVPAWAKDPNIFLVAHNAHFEYAVWNYILAPRYGWPFLWSPKHWGCTMSRAYMAGLPGSLDQCGMSLGIPNPKMMAGRAVMHKLCKPTHYDPLGNPVFREEKDHPRLFKELYEYCGGDVLAEMDLDSRIPELPPGERKNWEMDLEVNHRGIRIDLATAEKAEKVASVLTESLNAKLHDLTKGEVKSATKLAAMKRYLAKNGCPDVESLDKTAAAAIMANPAIPQHAKDVINIRRQVGKSSTSKYAAMRETACADGRARGMLQYHGAGTGRWAGRLLQPHNFPQGLKAKLQTAAIDVLLKDEGDGRLMSLVYGDDVMEVLSGILRGMMVPSGGKELIAVDYAAIEARVLFWEADDQVALDKYAAGVNLYVDMAKKIFPHVPNIGKEETPFEYGVGKRVVLGCGFQMGPDRFVENCAQFGITISLELSKMAVAAYREDHPLVKAMWNSVEDAAVNAVLDPGSRHPAMGGKILWGLTKDREWLVCRLPSGRCLWYYHPSAKRMWRKWDLECPKCGAKLKKFASHKPTFVVPCSTAGCYGQMESKREATSKNTLHFWGVESLTKKWCEMTTYGGSLVENVTQAIARDIMANGMHNAQAAGYDVLLTVHDEVLGEKASPNLKEFVQCLCDIPAWAKGCPIEAEGWVASRYRK